MQVHLQGSETLIPNEWYSTPLDHGEGALWTLMRTVTYPSLESISARGPPVARDLLEDPAARGSPGLYGHSLSDANARQLRERHGSDTASLREILTAHAPLSVMYQAQDDVPVLRIDFVFATAALGDRVEAMTEPQLRSFREPLLHLGQRLDRGGPYRSGGVDLRLTESHHLSQPWEYVTAFSCRDPDRMEALSQDEIRAWPAYVLPVVHALRGRSVRGVIRDDSDVLFRDIISEALINAAEPYS